VLLLAKFFKVENKKAGEYLFQEGDDGESPYFVGSGTVIVVMKIPRQQEKILRK
jgi:CRP-like cAMP-binding protein